MTRDELVKRISESQTLPFVCSEKLADLLLELTGTAGATAKPAAPPEPKRTRGQIAAENFLKREGSLFRFNDQRAGYGAYRLPSINGWYIDASIAIIRSMLAALIDAECADAAAAAREQCAVDCEDIRRAQTTGAAIGAANACAVRIRARKDGGM